MLDGACSRVEIEGGLVSAGLDIDILLRPSSASLRSVTPTPLVDLAKLCKEMFSMCIRAGDILRRGEMPSPRAEFSYEADFSTAMQKLLVARFVAKCVTLLTGSESSFGSPLDGKTPPESLPVQTSRHLY